MSARSFVGQGVTARPVAARQVRMNAEKQWQVEAGSLGWALADASGPPAVPAAPGAAASC